MIFWKNNGGKFNANCRVRLVKKTHRGRLILFLIFPNENQSFVAENFDDETDFKGVDDDDKVIRLRTKDFQKETDVNTALRRFYAIQRS